MDKGRTAYMLIWLAWFYIVMLYELIPSVMRGNKRLVDAARIVYCCVVAILICLGFTMIVMWEVSNE